MPAFDCFVIFADMRTGSNFLETALNSVEGVICHGEAYNPAFVGYPKRTHLLDFDRLVVPLAGRRAGFDLQAV